MSDLVAHHGARSACRSAAALAVWILPLSRYATGSLAVLVSLVEVGLWIEQAARFDFGRSGLQFSQNTPWIKDLHVSYHVGEYGFSLWLVGLTVVAMAACIGYGFWVGRDRARAYFGLMLFLTGATVGVFVAQDLLALLRVLRGDADPALRADRRLGRPGAARRDDQAAHLHDGRLARDARRDHRVRAEGRHVRPRRRAAELSRWLFLGFMLAFAIKAPLFPFHGWLPDAYREAPPEVTAVLSGVIAKAGAYGMLRIAITKFPDPASFYRTSIMALAAATLVYASVLAFRAPDFRGVVAYSSMAYSGLIALGLFSGTDLGYDGAVLQMVAHGLISVSLFLIAGAVERRTTTGEFALLGGMARGRPALATLLMATGIISLAVPGSASFAGEFLILAGVVPARVVVGGDRRRRDRARGDVHAAPDLRGAARGARLDRQRRGDGPAAG